MTPQERKLIEELFSRLASLENNPRDPDAVAAINDGLDRAPNALYPLVQTVLVQDEALKHADARIRELEDELGIDARSACAVRQFPRRHARQRCRPPRRLGALRSSRRVVGRNKGPVQRSDSPWNKGPVLPERSSWNDEPQPGGRWSMGQGPQAGGSYGAPGGPGQSMPGPYGGGPQPGNPAAVWRPGGSFLGTAAASAVGAIGGTLLMNSIRGMFGGGQPGGKAQAALDPGGGSAASPSGSSAAGSSLSRDAGLDDIGGSGSKLASYDNRASQRTGLFDSARVRRGHQLRRGRRSGG